MSLLYFFCNMLNINEIPPPKFGEGYLYTLIYAKISTISLICYCKYMNLFREMQNKSGCEVK